MSEAEQQFLENLIAWLKAQRDDLDKFELSFRTPWHGVDIVLDEAREAYYTGQMPWEVAR